jgi:hypothetical protein
MKQATATGGDVLVVAGLEAKEIAEFVVASAEPLRRGEALEAAHTSKSTFHAAIILLQSIDLVSAAAMDNPPVERVADGLRVRAVPIRGHLVRDWHCHVA